MMALLLSWRFWAAAVAAAVLAFTHFTVYRIGGAVVREKWTAERLAASERHAKELEASIARQRALQANIDRLRKENRNEVDRIARAHAAALDGLRNRPTERITAMPDPAGAAAGCTGAGLARPDAEFLAGYAADAEKLAAALGQCRAGYQAAKEQLESVRR